MSEIEKHAGVPAAPVSPLSSETESGGRLDVFADGRRRRALAYLAECDAPVSFDELVVAIAASETQSAPDTLAEDATKPVAIALHHVHLPKLLHEGYVRADADGLVLDVEETALDAL
ncbi:DUF7344 domain-containing protein [Halomarina rubra]|uniref:DUF7344 domain-containing protein n=1 Tax=Halomarina rubra TaxID=2071873 RepID=A0ABD6AZE7_9EURY|nr:hypothetical protein [Halomarina rubra]